MAGQRVKPGGVLTWAGPAGGGWPVSESGGFNFVDFEVLSARLKSV